MSDLDKTIDLSQFEIVKYIDQGSFGQVFEVSKKSTNEKYAAKISKEIVDPGSKEATLNLMREVNINASIIHPSILQFVGFSFTYFENNAKPVIITELSENGSLSKVIDYERKGLSIPGWDDTKKLINIFGIASGMSFLHSKNLLHRDLKLANILTDDHLLPKIADFGLSKKYSKDGFASSTQSISGLKGTPVYLSPEIIENQTYTPAGDVYAFGIVVYEIISNEQPFLGFNVPKIYASVLNGERPKIPNFVSESYRQLIEKCWSQNPNDRPTFDQIVEELKSDKFITPTVDEVSFLDYVDFIEKYRKTYDNTKKIIKFEDIVKNYQRKTFQKVSIQDITNQKKILPPMIYSELNGNCQKLVDEAANDSEKKFYVGKNLIEGQKGFPVNVEHGIKYLEISNLEGCVDAALYLSQIYLKGELIPQDTVKSKEYLLKYEYSNDSRVYNLLGVLYEKEYNYIEARRYFELGTKLNNPESMFKYSMMLIGGEGGKTNIDEAIKFINISKKHEYNKSIKYLSIFDELKTKKNFCKIPEDVLHIFTLNIFKHNKKQEIYLTGNNTEYIFNKELFFNTEFIKVLKLFSKISIEIYYPSNSFKQILSKMTEIKTKSIYNIDICVFILNSVNSIGNNAFSECSSLAQITIPSSVTSIGEGAFSKCSSLTQITIPSSVTSIGKNVFNGCSSLTQITFEIPSSVTSIKNSAFYGCSSLTQIIIPSSVTSIGCDAFNGCSSLTQITIPSSVISFSLKIFIGIKLLKITGDINHIPNELFDGCSSLTHITIPSSITSIGNNAFRWCSSLTQITFESPSSVTSIGNKAFHFCSSLTQITIPSSVTEIGDSAFSWCDSLTQIAIPSSVTSIGNCVFAICSKLTQITIPSSVTSIGDYAFNGCSLKQITIPSSVTSIGNYAFNDCSSLKQITIPSSVTSIGNNAFSRCYSLTQITIPSSVIEIGIDTFYECSKLTKIIIPSSIENIDKINFDEISHNKKVIIPSTVSSIGSFAFYNFRFISEIIIPSSVISIKSHAFYGCLKLTHIAIPSSVTKIGPSTFSGCSALIQITIPSSVTEIGSSAFRRCSSLIQFTIPSSVTKIGSYTFNGCSALAQIAISSSVTSIGDYAFEGCSSLTQITIPSSVTSIGNYAFSKCLSLTQVTITSSLTSIGDYAFSECSLLSPFQLPSSATSVGHSIFKGCKNVKPQCNIQ